VPEYAMSKPVSKGGGERGENKASDRDHIGQHCRWVIDPSVPTKVRNKGTD